ncbi:MAG TPA: phosphoribosylformylglycinamidine synthase, partial [Gammaproteobacteria bacterium]|nr:phosphoribosylformylglycinamidine synthase [Gammaproteobacteria bacterium]
PDLQSAEALKQFFNGIQRLNQNGQLLAYHDRSDGGLWAAICEMAFAAQVGMDLQLNTLGDDAIATLFNEELGAVVQIKEVDLPLLQKTFADSADIGLEVVGQLNDSNQITIYDGERQLYQSDLSHLLQLWRLTSFQMQKLRDDPQCAEEEFSSLLDLKAAKLAIKSTFDVEKSLVSPYLNLNVRPKVAILREQGVNGQVEMAAAFHHAGFEAIDMHMTDLLTGRQRLDSFKGMVACGGFSYGDVLGAGGGWAKSILFHSHLREQFSQFFHRADSFALGVCNGCQMMSQLRELIPGAEAWPNFVRNRSEQFEARLVSVEVMPSNSIFFADMVGSEVPVVVAHGEGQIALQTDNNELTQAQVALRYVNGRGEVAHTYPANPNGSKDGLTGFCNQDGRFTIMMPHPERVFRAVQYSWCPAEWQERSPWMRFFENARCWVD